MNGPSVANHYDVNRTFTRAVRHRRCTSCRCIPRRICIRQRQRPSWFQMVEENEPPYPDSGQWSVAGCRPSGYLRSPRVLSHSLIFTCRVSNIRTLSSYDQVLTKVHHKEHPLSVCITHMPRLSCCASRPGGISWFQGLSPWANGTFRLASLQSHGCCLSPLCYYSLEDRIRQRMT